MSQLKYKHFFTVKDGEIIWESEEMFYNVVLRAYEGKRAFAYFEEAKEDKPNQYAYYFAGIIRKECMASESFAGLGETQIHERLMMEVGSYETIYYHSRTSEKMIRHEIPEDIKKWSKKRMSQHIEQVIALLNTDYQIYPKDPSFYKENKYYMDLKVFKAGDPKSETTE